MKPFPFQVHDLATLRKNDYVAMLSMQTGSGKTALSTWAAGESGAKTTLVVCPAQTMETAWKPTVANLLGIEAREIGNSNKAKKEALFDFEIGTPGVYLITPQLLTRAETSGWSGDLMILDEAHVLMTPGTKGAAKLYGNTPLQGEASLARRFGGRLTLSGTSLRNRFELAWGYGRTLWPELNRRGEMAHDNFYMWQADRMDYKTVYTAQRDRDGNPKTIKQYYGEKDPGRWFSEAPCVITHLKREACCEFHTDPPGYLPLDEPTVRHERIVLASEQKTAIKELEEHYVTWLGENPLVVDIPLTKAQRIRQMTLGVPTVSWNDEDEMSVTFDNDCKSPHLDRLLDILNNEIEDETCMVYTDSAKFAAVTTARLNAAGIKAFEYSGQTRKDRDENLSKLGTEYRVMVGVIAAAGTGLDSAQRVCKNEVWLSADMDETNNEQARGRLDRLGGIGQVMRWVFHDDIGISEGRFSEALSKRLELNRSLRRAA